MGRPINLWSAIVGAAALLACGGSTEQDIVQPSPNSRCQMRLDAPQPLPATGAQVQAQLSTSRECAWSLQTTAAWLQIEPASGQGAATLTLTAAVNPQGRSRSAPITINDQPFAVEQDAAPCRFEVIPASISMGHQGGRASVQLSTLEGCSWTTQSSQPWLRVVAGSGGDASATLELAIDSNAESERSALLSVATLLVPVNQGASPNDRNECRFSVTPGGVTVPASGATRSFSVATLPRCNWHPASSQSWLVVVSSGNVVGSSEVVYRVDPNPLTTTRSGAITAGTRRHVVTQEPQPRP